MRLALVLCRVLPWAATFVHCRKTQLPLITFFLIAWAACAAGRPQERVDHFEKRWFHPLQRLPPCWEDDAVSCVLEHGVALLECDRDAACAKCAHHHACMGSRSISASRPWLTGITDLKGYISLRDAAHTNVNHTTWLVFHVQRIFAAAVSSRLPLMARSGFLLGIVRQAGFIPYDRDPDVMIPVAYTPEMVKVISKLGYPYKCMFSEDRFLIIYRHVEIMSGIFLFDSKDGKHMTLGQFRLYGVNETELFYGFYGHNFTELPLYSYQREHLLPPKLALFYDRFVLVPSSPEDILRYQYGSDVFKRMFDKTQWIEEGVYQRMDATILGHIAAHIDWNALENLHQG